jgi:hypothetical protein
VDRDTERTIAHLLFGEVTASVSPELPERAGLRIAWDVLVQDESRLLIIVPGRVLADEASMDLA